MRKIKFTKKDREQFAAWGYSGEDIQQIARLRYEITDYSNKKDFETACSTLGRINVLGAISRAAFHSSGNINGTGWFVVSNLMG